MNFYRVDLSSLKENLRFLADTQRILLESFQTQQQHHMTENNVENPHYQDNNEPAFDYGSQYEDQLGSKNYDHPAQPTPTINNYYPPAAPAYAAAPPLPPLPYGDDSKQYT